MARVCYYLQGVQDNIRESPASTTLGTLGIVRGITALTDGFLASLCDGNNRLLTPMSRAALAREGVHDNWGDTQGARLTPAWT